MPPSGEKKPEGGARISTATQRDEGRPGKCGRCGSETRVYWSATWSRWLCAECDPSLRAAGPVLGRGVPR